MKSINFNLNFLFKIIFSIFLSTNIFALDSLPNLDQFTSSTDGYSPGSEVSGMLLVGQNEFSQKTYDFGAANANKSIRISFSIRYTYDWDAGSDEFIVNVNGAEKINDSTLDGEGSKSYVIETTTDTDGKVNLQFNPDTNNNGEIAYIDNVLIDELSEFVCSNPKDFTSIYTSNDYQKTLLIGNTSLCADDNKDGKCEDPGTSRNNDIYMINYDADSDTATTINSSAALLDMPEDKEVSYAGLFWQGYLFNKTDTDKNLAKLVKFKHEDGSYQDITADDFNWVYYGSDASQAFSRFYYQGYKDVTSIVNNYKDGNYWVGDLQSTEGDGSTMTGGGYGAWSLVVVYKDSNETFRNATVFHGFKGVVGSGDVSGAEDYASANVCTLTGVDSSVSSTLDGFITPRENTVDSTLFVFAGEGDKGATGDSGSITDSSGTAHSLTNGINPSSDIMNSTISIDGVHVTTGTPYFSNNSLGIDIDSFDVSSFIDNEQSSTTITLNTSGDGYQPGMYALETQLFVPDLCYDYAYKQDGSYFTESNDGTKDPYIKGTVTAGHPITVGMYIKNRVASDINVTDFTLDVYDINTSVLTYERESTYITASNSIISQLYPDDEVGRSVADSYTKGINIGTIDANDYFYLYYDLNPLSSSINEPIKLKASYYITIGGNTIPYETVIGKNINLCTDNNFRYKPAKSIFSVLHQDYYDFEQGGTNQYYNLPTQVVKREGNFKVVAFDPDSLDTPQNVSTMVGVEMIQLDVFHDSNASCQQLESAVSERVWVLFNDQNSTSFDKTAIENSIAMGLTNLTNSEDFYSTALKNATFRVTFNTTRDGNDDLIQLEEGTGSDADKFKFVNFTELVQDIGICADGREVINPQTGNPSSQVSVLCGNAGNYHGLNQIKACQECVYGYSTRYICARDDFAIRPEALHVRMYDQDTNNTSKLLLDNNTTQNLAAGHSYYIDINATTHTDSGSSLGYTKTIDPEFTDDELGYEWEPRNGVDVSGCNDTNNAYRAVKPSDGYIDFNSSIEQVGDYRFHVLDTTWTKADSDPTVMTHHVSPYYITANTPDCKADSSVVKSNDPYPVTDVLNGCNISSSHTNVDTGTIYKDYNITFHPYTFDISTISLTKNPSNTAIVDNDFVYMQDISQDDNVSLHLNGDITAVSETNTPMSNFVDSCFAKPLTISVNSSDTNHSVTYQNKFIVLDNSRTSDNNISGSSTVFSLNTNTSDFIKDSNGSISTILNMNYFRDQTNAVNPINVTYNSYDVNCTTTSNCKFTANLNTNKTTTATKTLDLNVRHVYGRTNAPRQIFKGSQGNAFIYFETYCSGSGCDKNFLPNGSDSNSTNDPRWFVNTTHTINDGVAGNISQKNSGTKVSSSNTIDGTPTQTTLTYDGTSGYPYKTTMQNFPSSWLVYDRFNPNDTTNEFEVEFINPDSSWGGVDDANSTSQTGGAGKTNRRIMW